MRTVFILIILVLTLSFQSLFAQANQKNRVVILTDIEADPGRYPIDGSVTVILQ